MLGFLRSSMFIAQIFGTIVFTFTEDRIGKRKVFLICLLSTSVGSLLMYVSSSLAVAVLGQYLIGFGKYPLIKFGIALISDITKPSFSQKLIPSIRASYSFGAILGSFAYGSLKHWRVVVLYFSFIPYAFTLILTFIFLRDTPRYLLRKCTATEAKDSLDFVAKVSGRSDRRMGSEQAMDQELHYTEVKENMNPFDLLVGSIDR